MSVTGTIREVVLLPAERRDEMFALMARYYENMRRDVFDADLDEKQWVIEIEDVVTGALCGFSTQMVFDVQVSGRPVRALFSGDTIIDRRYWQRVPILRADRAGEYSRQNGMWRSESSCEGCHS